MPEDPRSAGLSDAVRFGMIPIPSTVSLGELVYALRRAIETASTICEAFKSGGASGHVIVQLEKELIGLEAEITACLIAITLAIPKRAHRPGD